MSTFGDDLIQAMTEALAHAKGEGPAIVHTPVAPREVREQARLTQAQRGRFRLSGETYVKELTLIFGGTVCAIYIEKRDKVHILSADGRF